MKISLVCSWGFNWYRMNFGSDNGLVLNRPQAITQTNDNPVDWDIYASPGLNELTMLTSKVA